MKRRGRPHHLPILASSLLACGLFVLSGCASSQVSTTATLSVSTDTTTVHTSSTASGESGTSTTLFPSAFRSPFVEQTYLASQPVDLSKVANLGKANLSESQKNVLARQSFVAVVPAANEQPWKFWQVYESARYQGLPLLVTTDSILNTYHGLFNTLLQRMEEKALFEQARTMTEALYGAAYAQSGTATDAVVKEDARLNMAYFAVARALLNGSTKLPGIITGDRKDELQAMVDLAASEVALIEAADGPADSPILGYTEDYSQYKPRGHYTRSDQLRRYFKAMMWYGHTAFYINPREPDLPEALAVSLSRRAILISSSLVGPAKEAWSAVYEPTSFLVGRADDITVDDMREVITQVFGTSQPAPDELADVAKIAKVREKLNKLPVPKILTAATRAPGDTENREENERSFRVMGQRYIPDSYAFQQLVWAYVGTAPDNKRDLPMGLDIMTVLGSDQAYKIAKQDYAQDKYQNWETQLEKVNQEFSERTPDLWPANLYTGWLESLQQVMTLPAAGAPDFMKTKVWARKSLNTALGSWTELRHDTILYAKQSVTAEGGGGEEPQDPGYVEPYPAFYARIGELATTLRQGLVDYGLIDPEAANKLEMMISLTDTLRSAAEKELAGEELAPDEKLTISEYGHYLEILEQFNDAEEGRTLSPTAEKSPLVADVHTSYNSNRALEEATGYPLVLYAAFELNGKVQLFAGASYAYYEFTVPLNERLTDEEWTSLLDTGKAPPRPAWTNGWIVSE
jgi:hypothetical protein